MISCRSVLSTLSPAGFGRGGIGELLVWKSDHSSSSSLVVLACLVELVLVLALLLSVLLRILAVPRSVDPRTALVEVADDECFSVASIVLRGSRTDLVDLGGASSLETTCRTSSGRSLIDRGMILFYEDVWTVGSLNMSIFSCCFCCC